MPEPMGTMRDISNSGFLKHYVKKHRLDTMPEKHKKNIAKLEEKIAKHVEKAPGPLKFDDVLKEHGQKIADLVERLSDYIKDMPSLSFSGVISLFRFVYSISIEIFQIVKDVSGAVVDDSMTDEEQHDAKVTFGKELVYFVWLTVDPLGKRFNWIPFKKTIEKKLVMWLAGMALESAVDLFDAGAVQSMAIMSADPAGAVFLKAIP